MNYTIENIPDFQNGYENMPRCSQVDTVLICSTKCPKSLNSFPSACHFPEVQNTGIILSKNAISINRVKFADAIMPACSLLMMKSKMTALNPALIIMMPCFLPKK